MNEFQAIQCYTKRRSVVDVRKATLIIAYTLLFLLFLQIDLFPDSLYISQSSRPNEW